MNEKLLEILKESFNAYITDGPRSNQKLKYLHHQISKDVKKTLTKLNTDKNANYDCFSLDLDGGKEMKISGRYMDKTIDISVYKNGVVIAGIAVKFVMSNFNQNKGNYFENMLGETANIRTNNYPYYQIFIVADKLPYYNKNGFIKKWEEISIQNLKKYFILANDDTSIYFHVPNKIFLGLISIPTPNVKTKLDYNDYFENNFDFKIEYSSLVPNFSYSKNLIYNDYENFIAKIAHHILSI